MPTCIDCHGVHDIPDPRTAAFRLASPRMCADCHTDAQKMAKYKLSTQVLRTYVADFHGSTVTLFQRRHPDQVTGKPVCYDCHGVHDIASKSDPKKGLQVKGNLLATCRKCHPDATTGFPDAWLSHYVPTRDRDPLVYWSRVGLRRPDPERRRRHGSSSSGATSTGDASTAGASAERRIGLEPRHEHAARPLRRPTPRYSRFGATPTASSTS